MKNIILILVCLPFFTVAQRTYNVIGYHVSSQTIANIPPGIAKVKMVVIITDSLFTVINNGQTTTSTIIKRVNENYFKITDGLKEAIVRINNQKIQKYSGAIVEEDDDKNIVTMFFK